MVVLLLILCPLKVVLSETTGARTKPLLNSALSSAYADWHNFISRHNGREAVAALSRQAPRSASFKFLVASSLSCLTTGSRLCTMVEETPVVKKKERRESTGLQLVTLTPG
jgi:hypothetical protein